MYYTDESDEAFYGKFRTYKLIEGDTLQSVSQKLGIEARELRSYHNMRCQITDLIENDFKRYSKFLILAPEKSIEVKKEETEKKAKKVILSNNYKLPFLPEHTDKKYKVKYTSEVNDQIDITEMEISVKWIATDKNGYHLFEITRSKAIYVNALPPTSLIGELGAKSAEALYPLKIVVNKSGKWVDIYNYDEIVERWRNIKKEILDYFEGELTEVYIDRMEKTLKKSETLLKSLRSDYFLRTFFNGIHVGYTEDYSFENEVSFPLEDEEEAIFEVQQKINPFLDQNGFIKVAQKGIYMDSVYGFLYGYNSSKVNYSTVYFLNSEKYTVEKMNIQCNILSNESIKKTIEVVLLK